jgi:glucuronoarabinoxylan endo-1,4-beta-xylanase
MIAHSKTFARLPQCFCLGAAALLVPFSARADGIKLEAETGVLGSDYAVTNDGSATYIAIRSNSTGESPGSTARVATFTVTFPAAGTYDLYARVRVGSGGADDDSVFYGNGFGTKSPSTAADWIRMNSLNVGGYANPGDVVSGSGTAGIGMWKWINLSEFANGSSEAGITFAVTSGNLTQTFQIGAREDGFDVDAIVFGTSSYVFAVTNLDAGTDGSPPVTTSGACLVNWNQTYQVIDGFGASSAWRSTWSSSVADMFFSTNTGIGLSLLRTRIAPGATTVENSIMQMARDRGARVWSAPWSPATQFKSNTNVNGGNFVGNAANYQAYANQLAGYVVNMKNQYNVTIDALSIQNEPDANVTTYESCKWTAQQIHDFIPYLASALAASNVAATKILLPESQNWTDPQGLRLTAMNDPSVASLVGIIANHNYVPDNNNGDQTVPAAINNYGKALWETEVSTFDAFDSSMADGIYWAWRIHAFLTVAQLNAWHYWWLSAAGTDNSGLASNGDVLAKRGYVVGQYSRFVRPGSYRLGVVTNLGTAMVSAFKDPVTGRFAIVAINSGSTVIDQTFSLTNFGAVGSVTPWITSSTLSLAGQTSVTVTNGSFEYLLPEMSVVTFVGQSLPNTAPTLASVPDQNINAGVTLVITNTASDPDVPAQVLTFSLITSPPGSTLNSSNGIFTWRPPVNQADTTNAVTVSVTDSGSPALGDINSFLVAVNPLEPPAFSSITAGDGQITLVINGDFGPDYSLLTSTNLVDWEVLLTTNSPALPLTLVITSQVEPGCFYRVRLGP